MDKTELRIVAGTLRGRKVLATVHPGLRPTPQLVRQALFSILGDAVPDRVFYDLFAGTGVIGLEAVSRGASGARLIERDAKQAGEIQKAIDQFRVRDKAQVLRADVYRWAERWAPTAEPVNLFLSPPFPDLSGPKLDEFLRLVITLDAKMPPGSVLTVQAELGFPTDRLPDPPAWDVREYSRNLLLFRVKDTNTALESVQPGGEFA
ncbi:MAG: RsmD family RNA methyltransferase [Fimbriiglobus sp.]|jgi:16S rRNA (guanine966-N2)-methyltransferase|nr:RsmD family RNA methyltransferase [Fimbriiglobus sp.]